MTVVGLFAGVEMMTGFGDVLVSAEDFSIKSAAPLVARNYAKFALVNNPIEFCQKCHLSDDKRLLFQWAGSKFLARIILNEIYHDKERFFFGNIKRALARAGILEKHFKDVSFIASWFHSGGKCQVRYMNVYSIDNLPVETISAGSGSNSFFKFKFSAFCKYMSGVKENEAFKLLLSTAFRAQNLYMEEAGSQRNIVQSYGGLIELFSSNKDHFRKFSVIYNRIFVTPDEIYRSFSMLYFYSGRELHVRFIGPSVNCFSQKYANLISERTDRAILSVNIGGNNRSIPIPDLLPYNKKDENVRIQFTDFELSEIRTTKQNEEYVNFVINFNGSNSIGPSNFFKLISSRNGGYFLKLDETKLETLLRDCPLSFTNLQEIRMSDGW